MLPTNRVVPGSASRTLLFAGAALFVSFTPACKGRAPAPAPKAAAPAAAESRVLGWARVNGESLPLFREPEAELEELVTTVEAGTLLERRRSGKLPPKDQKVLVQPQTFEHAGVKWVGVLEEVQLHGGESLWTISAGLDKAPTVPPREALCAALARASVAEARSCVARGRFLQLSDGGGRPRPLLAAYVDGPSERTVLAIVSLGATPTVKGQLPVGALAAALKQEALPGDKTLFIAQEYVRRGTLTGRQYAFLIVDETGAIAREKAVPMQTSEPIRGLATQRTGRVVVERGPDGPTIRVKTVEVVQAIDTGKVRSRRELTETIQWASAQQRFLVANGGSKARRSR
jgi:hypothetical protein